MIAAVTGASGHVGGNLVRLLMKRGYSVRALVHEDDRAIKGLEIEIVKGSILDRKALAGLVQGADIVFHCVALISIDQAHSDQVIEINVAGTENILDVCRDKKIGRFVHFSSIHAFSPKPRNKVTNESRALLSENEGLPYDRSKAKSEMLALDAVSHGLDSVIVNPTAILGPLDYKPSLTGEMILSILEQKLIALVQGGFNWVDVRDVAEGAILAALKGKTGERYLLSGNWHTIREIALMLKEVSGCKLPCFDAPMWLARLGAPVTSWISTLAGKKPLYTSGSLAALRSHRFISSDKAKQELGWKTRPISDTIRDTFAWFRDGGYLDT